VFALDDFGLFGLAVIGGVGEGLALIKNADLALEIDRDSDDRLAHGVGGTIHLDLIDEVMELQG